MQIVAWVVACGMLSVGVRSFAEPECDPVTRPGEDGAWGPLFVRDAGGVLTPSVSIVPYADSELWLEGRLYLGMGEPLFWTQGPYSALTGDIALELPEIGATLSALRVRAVARDPDTGVLRSVRNAERVYVYQSGRDVLVLSEEAARTAAGQTTVPNGAELVEDAPAGREVAP